MTDIKEHAIDPYVLAAMGRKAENIVALDVSRLTSYTDVLLIVSGRSNRQVSAIAEYIKVTLKKEGITPLSVDGMQEGLWVLMDYGHIIIHVFYEETRAHYDIEGLWADADPVDIEHLKSEANEAEDE